MPSAPPPPPPTPSAADADGPLFVRADVEHPTKTKPDGVTPVVSLKELPVGSRLRLDGPGPDDPPVLCTRRPARGEDRPVVWECVFRPRRRREGEGEDESEDAADADGAGEAQSRTFAGTNCSCNFQSLYNHAQSCWASSAGDDAPKSPPRKKKKPAPDAAPSAAATAVQKAAKRAAKKAAKPRRPPNDGAPDAERSRADFRYGEGYYRALSAERDAEVRALRAEVRRGRRAREDQRAVIDRLRAELVRSLEALAAAGDVAPPRAGVAGGGEGQAAAAAAADGTPADKMAVDAPDGDKKGGQKKTKKGKRKRGSLAPERRLDTDKQRQYRAKLEERWNGKLQQLKEYKERFGDCNVPLNFKENTALGAWVNKQRDHYRSVIRGETGPGAASKISDERIAQLEALGMCWNVRTTRDGSAGEVLTDVAWNANLTGLEAYQKEHGDCLVPKSYNEKLVTFVYAVRRMRKRQQEYREQAAAGAQHAKKMPGEHWLTQARIERLDELGFTWSIRESPAEIWNQRYEKLKAFKETFGHCRVPAKYDKPLNQWMLAMRHYYKNTMNESKAGNKKFAKLSAEKIFQLQLLGFEWDVLAKDNEQAWETRFRDMIRYRSEHGHCRVPKQYPPDTKLSHWVYEQRKNYKSLQTGSKRGRRGLTDDRIRRLEEIGFEWSVLPPKQEPEVEVEGEMGADATMGYNLSTMEVASGYNQAGMEATDQFENAATETAGAYDPSATATEAARGFDHSVADATKGFEQNVTEAARGFDHAVTEAARGYDHTAAGAVNGYDHAAAMAANGYDQTSTEAVTGYDQSVLEAASEYNHLARRYTDATRGYDQSTRGYGQSWMS